MKKISNKLFSMLVIVGITFATISIASCSKSSGGSSGPAAPSNPDGADSSNQIQAGALVAYWSFNGNLTDSKGGLTATNSGVTFTSGLNGKMAYQGAANQTTYASYVSSSAIKSMTSFTIAFWLNSGQVDSGAQAILQLSNPLQYWPELDVDLEQYTPGSGPSDSLHLKMYMENAANNVWTVAPEAYLDTAVGKWTHVVITYNAAAGSVTMYQNGIAIYMTYPYSQTTTVPNGSVGPIPFYTSDPGSLTNTLGAPLWGNADFSVSNNFVIGSWQGKVSPAFNPGEGSDTWNDSYAGSLQNFRIYNTALSAADVASLYILERGGF
jgi:hypothetical protein